MERDLELNQIFFLGNRVDDEQDLIDNQKIIPKKTIEKRKSGKNFSPTKVESRNFLTNISYTCLKSINFDNVSFIINCFTYIFFNLNPFFLEWKFNFKSNRDYVKMLWNYLIPNEFYIYICRNDNFIALNKLLLKYQNAFDIISNFILVESNNFVSFKEFFKKYVLLYQYIYSNLFPKYFCRIDNYDVTSKMAFEVAYAGYQNQ